MSDFLSPDLPVAAVLPDLLKTLEQQPNAVLVAPPGAGKTTLTPLALLEAAWLAGQKIILVEPRRVAVRGAASRMASTLGERPGETVGFRTRTDSAVSGRTRIEVVTEGLLVRRLLADPTLDGVGAVLFDEVHERSLDLDAALAFCLDLQRELRPDLRILAMSATPDGRAFTNLMNAALIESEGRQYPIDIRHTRDVMHPRDLPEACARAIRQAFTEEEGDILAFLPGVGEIRRTQALLGEAVPVFLLHGEQTTEDQDRAIAPSDRRRVVLATSIAETSVTVSGVRIVVDGGLRRAPRLDSNTGLSRLETLKISRATATQRAGRAGRQSPGVAIRLWSEATQRSLPPQDAPEILVADLTDFALVTAAWQDVMGTAPDMLPLLDAPPAGVLAGGRELLRELGALNEAGQITALGKRMVGLGTHPRLAAMLCAAKTIPERVTAACLAALLEERDPLRPRPNMPSGASAGADIRTRLALFERDDPRADRASLFHMRQAAKRFLRRMGGKDLPLSPMPSHAGALLAAGFPDRVAQAAGEIGRFRLAGGGSARVQANDGLAREKLLAAAAFHTRTSTEITLAAPLDAEKLPQTLLDRTTEQVETSLDGASGRIIARRRLRLGALILRDRNTEVTPEEAQALLLQQIAADLARALNWSDSAFQFQARVAHARATYAPHLPDLSMAALADDLAWLEPYLAGCDRLTQVKALDLLSILRARLDYSDLSALDRKLPPRLTLKASTHDIDYTGAVPTVSARAQAFYGTVGTPLLADGAVPLQCALLSPAGRPQAITADLAGFWKGSWSDMRKDMRGRYPRHYWPEDPATAEPPKPRPKR
ncbi:ATP-dependent helicase HrpB [Gluconobacter cerinus]|uniref:ATP-dependent helicase HrpB n=1 Tax=Gluconobacter cerinus TaxID=38307 RepID=UPI001B8BF597|nr:ATP-dependent helicase HrpB [Gluconobacter cerinus]MBS1023783.1 ATP-dependent helicase HrpB [Gluconobacter cerinus]MBS1044713.1 ATP-dependent helicase HrpB [Gluconobacter cerinus]